MNSTFKKLGLAAVVAASALVPYAYANGVFFGYPIVGGAAYCDGTNVQQTTTTVPNTAYTNSNCSATAPAGPSTLTGAEVVPADTGLSQGQAPQTVRVPIVMSAGGAYATSAPLTGTTITVGAGISNYLAVPAGTIAALTVNLPPSPIDGQTFHFATTQTITALTLAGGTGSATVDASPSGLTRSTSTLGTMGLAWIYKAADNKWYRLQ